MPLTSSGRIDAKQIIEIVRNNVATDLVNGRHVAFCEDIDAFVQLTRDGITHGYGSKAGNTGKTKPTNADMVNARAAMLLPNLINAAVEVNRSRKYATATRPYGHVLMSVYEKTDSLGGQQLYAVRMVVEHNTAKKRTNLLSLVLLAHSTLQTQKKCTHSTVTLAVQVLPRHPL